MVDVTKIVNDICDQKSIHSLTFSSNVSKLIGAFYENIETNIKYKIGNHIYDKYYNYIDRNITKKMRAPILNFHKDTTPIATIGDVVKLAFLGRYKDGKLVLSIATELYNANVRNNLLKTNYFQLLQYIIKCPETSPELRELILDEFEQIFADRTVALTIKMNIADIFLHMNRRERGTQMLQIIRVQEGLPKNNQKTIYTDSQNVHDTSINETNLRIAKKLFEMYSNDHAFVEKCNDDSIVNIIRDELIKIGGPPSVVSDVLDRMQIDTTYFGSVTLLQTLFGVWYFIEKAPDNGALKARLLEEFGEMHTVCSTGHFARTINVIQGFTNDPDLQMKISDIEQMKSVITHYLNVALEKVEDDSVHDGLIATDNDLKKPFLKFISDSVNKKLAEWKREYSVSDAHVIAIISQYTNFDKWKIENDQLIINIL